MSGKDDGPEPGVEPGLDAGPDAGPETAGDAVKEALNRARSAARERGFLPGAAPGARAGRPRRARSDQSRRSGAHPDARDPQTMAASVHKLVAEHGWQTPVAVGGVIGRWDAVVGAEIAAHCRPEVFTDGVLTVRADSTAWATQVRLLLNTLMRRLDEELGEGVVTKVVVQGPTAPTWRRGPRTAPGQGPRDTYG